MEQIRIETHGPVALVRLKNGVTNAISPLLLDELIEATGTLKENYNGAVIAGGDKFFCIGLDLPALLAYNREQMGLFWDRFDQAILGLYSLPIPVAAAVNGHATAGGAIVALTADYRFVGAGRKLIGLNEVNIGLPVPFLADLMLRQVTGHRAATQMVYSGDLIQPDDALNTGLVDDILPGNRVETHALAHIAELARKPQPAYRIIKHNRIESVQRQFAPQRTAKRDELLDCWFQPAVQGMLARAAEKF